MATTALNPGEAAQLQQTIEMFEVIVQSQPSDTQSLEILKEAYSKLGREQEGQVQPGTVGAARGRADEP